MLDKVFVRENRDYVLERLKARDIKLPEKFEMFFKLDIELRRIQTEVDSLRSQRNAESQKIGEMMKQKDLAGAESAKILVNQINQRIADAEAQLEIIQSQVTDILLNTPNLPDKSVPFGYKEDDKVEIKRWGEPRKFDGKPLDHVQIAENLGLIDFEAGTRVSGHGFYFLTGFGARLQRALIQFMLDLHTNEHGYKEMGTPYLVLPIIMQGTGQLPKFAEDMFKCADDDLYLIPTAEVPVTNYYRDTILEKLDEPIKLTAFTPCFRREAGSHGKDTRGILRVHQFDKIELVIFCQPEQSWNLLEILTHEAETVLERLELPYRRVALPTGDMGFSAAKTYDLEVLLPSDQSWREVSSATNFTDFQARRAKIRYRDTHGKPQLVHTLNASGLALPRTYAAFLENHQTEDGSLIIPPALRPYLGGMKIFKA